MDFAAYFIGIIIGLILCLPILGFAIVTYIFNARALSAIAKRRGFERPWLAWIPFACNWLAGSLADDCHKKVDGKDTKWKLWLLIAGILPSAISFVVIIPYIGYMMYYTVTIAYSVLSVMVFYKIYRSCDPEKSMMYLILSIFTPAAPFLLYAARNKENGVEVVESVEIINE